MDARAGLPILVSMRAAALVPVRIRIRTRVIARAIEVPPTSLALPFCPALRRGWKRGFDAIEQGHALPNQFSAIPNSTHTLRVSSAVVSTTRANPS